MSLKVHLLAPHYMMRTLCNRPALDWLPTVDLGDGTVTCATCRRKLLLLVARSLGATRQQIRNDFALSISVRAQVKS